MKHLLKKLSHLRYDVQLIAETPAEQKLLKDNTDADTIVLYYHSAIAKSLGSDANLVKVLDQSLWPTAAIVEVHFSKGMGS